MTMTTFTKARCLLPFAMVAFLTVFAFAQGGDRNLLLRPLGDSWPTYNGDYSARRFSSLSQINSSNVHTLSLAWSARFSGSAGASGGRGAGTVSIKSTP